MPEAQKQGPAVERPLSPHLSIYRWQISNGLSILHRLTGFALALGLVPLIAWVWGVAYGPEWFATLQSALTSIIGQLFLFGWTVAFFYHLGNGIRHLFWDMGHGFAIPDMTATGRLVLVFTVTMSIFTWVLVLKKTGAL
ncbi:MAG: succinate dehydrogenase, cytochrome b556 subunit [Alphaproteobacteria bacterium]